MGQFSFTFSDIKKAMGDNLGLRNNKYIVEIPLTAHDGKALAILARSTGLPEANVGTVEFFHKGRRFRARGETDFSPTYTINFTDDSEMKVRQLFDNWRLQVDNTEPRFFEDEPTSFIAKTLGNGVGSLMEVASGAIQFLNSAKNMFSFDGGSEFWSNMLTKNPGAPAYQLPINVWQLDKSNDKIYGYQLQNAFPTEIGNVEISDDAVNELSQFSVTFTYSELIPIKAEKTITKIFRKAGGVAANEIIHYSEQLFS